MASRCCCVVLGKSEALAVQQFDLVAYLGVFWVAAFLRILGGLHCRFCTVNYSAFRRVNKYSCCSRILKVAVARGLFAQADLGIGPSVVSTEHTAGGLSWKKIGLRDMCSSRARFGYSKVRKSDVSRTIVWEMNSRRG